MLPLFALLACAPRYGDLPAMAPEDIASPLPVQTIEVDGVTLAYVDSGGEGRTVVFVHGLSSWMAFWEYQIPEVSAAGYRVLALDLPGYGMSERPDAPYTPPWYASIVAGFLDELEVESAVVVGHSMGGQTALTMALEHPEKVDALALAAPAGFETFDAGARAWMKDYWTEDRALYTSETHLRVAFTQQVFNHVDEGVERLLEERVRMGKHESFRGTSVAVSRSIAGMLDHPVADRLGDIAVPTLIVYGTKDRMIPNPVFTGGRTKTIAESGRDAIPGAQLVMLDGAGHTVHHDDPAGFNTALLDFLARLP
ncbi:MAG: alpha/beta hydrolase [Deltaproteobacteria bacterium]|nr:MAG: alpha/beta hydrolase [Deltaproteobacteria bacterium]